MTVPLHVSIDRLATADRHRIEEIISAAVIRVAPALALCVWHEGQPVLDIHGGWIDPSEPGLAVHGDAQFDLASLSKLFTMTAFLVLAEERGVALDDRVISVLPEFAAVTPRGVDGGQEPLTRRLLPVPTDRAAWTVDPGSVTFRHLLTHTSGMAPWRSLFLDIGPAPGPPGGPEPMTSDARQKAGLRAVFGFPFVARPGEEVHYSDLGFITLGAAVERLFEGSLDEAIRARVSSPLELGSVGYAPGRSGVGAERTVPTSIDGDWRGRRCWGEVEDENAAALGGIAGHAGIFATARDVARFGQAWLEGDERLGLDSDTASAATSSQTPGLAANRGLGWQLQGSGSEHLAPFGQRAFGHTGFTGTSLAIDPDRGSVVALLTNRVYGGRRGDRIDELRLGIHGALAGVFG